MMSSTLLDIQLDSYREFLQARCSMMKRVRIQAYMAAFTSVFPLPVFQVMRY